MTLNPETADLNPDQLIQFGRDDALDRLCALARAEAKNGDGRALRAIERLAVASGLRSDTKEK